MNLREKEDLIKQEMAALNEDLLVFNKARDLFQSHINGLETEHERREHFVSWAVFQIIWNGLIVATARCEETIEHYRSQLETLGDRRKDAKVFELVRRERHE